MQTHHRSRDAHLVAPCQEEVEDAGVLLAQKVLSKFLILFIKLAWVKR